MNESAILKQIEVEIASRESLHLSSGSFATTYSNTTGKITTLHFSRKFIDNLGWDFAAFGMFCLFNGLPE